MSPEKQIFYCFGCHTGGNVFSFISKIEGLTFPESVKFVGEIVGIKAENKPDGKYGKDNSEYISDRLKEINRSAMEYYHKTVFSDSGKSGLNYIRARGVTEESLKEFKIGYSPDAWQSLVNHLNNIKIDAGMAFKIGLIGSKDKIKYYDRYRNRVIFPIINHKNEVIAFGGRAIDGTEPKYLNSPESEIYHKREVLYGLNIAKQYISEYKRAIVVEGYLDCLGCHQAGLKNTVAPLGTALTAEQLKLLSRYCKEVVLLFDADSAGIKASLRSIDMFRNVNLEVKIAVLPELDPFDFIIKKGARELMVIIDKALNPLDYQINRAIIDGKSKEKVDILLDVFKIIRDIEFETERQTYLKKAGVMLNIPENSIRADFERFLKKENKPKKELFAESLQTVKESDKDFLIKSYREIMILLCHFPELIEHARMDFTLNELPDGISKNIFTKLTELYSNNEKISIDKIYDYFTEGEEKAFLEKSCCNILNMEAANNDYTKRYIRIRLEHINQKIEYYGKLINNPGTKTNKERNDILAEYQIWQREKDKLNPHL